MTSQTTSTAEPSIMWDKSRLHRERAPRKGKALVPASSGEVGRRVSSNGPSTTPSGRLRPRLRESSDLKMSFDPMKDQHLWTMWRVAVNGRIVDEAQRRNRTTQPAANGVKFEPNPYGRALVKTPLDRFIRVENGSQNIARLMMDPHGEGGDRLGTQQFVFYGVPRVVLKKPKRTVHLP